MSFAPLEALRESEAALVEALALEPAPVSSELASMEGRYRGEPVALRARAYTGERIAWARFVELRGAHLEIANVLCLPAPTLNVPVLGMDLVDLRQGSVLVVADLSPAQGAGHPDFAARRARAPALPRARELPAWALRWFSKDAVFARVAPEQDAAARQALADVRESFIVQLEQACGRPELRDATLAHHAAYCAAHREEDRALALLTKLFEARSAHRLLHELLFPCSLGSDRTPLAGSGRCLCASPQPR